VEAVPLGWPSEALPLNASITYWRGLVRLRKVTAEKATIRRVPAVLEAWVRFAGDRRNLPTQLVDETVAMIHVLADEFRARNEDPQAFGMAKRITMAMRDEGVDVSDHDAVERWIAGFNQRDELNRSAIVG
jgi:hypothetical protein